MLSRLPLATTALALISVMSLPGAPQPPRDYPHPRGYVCLRAPSPISVDGRLDEAAWRSAAWSDDFVDMADPAVSPAPRTRVKMLWDEGFLYIAADIAEPHLWAEM